MAITNETYRVQVTLSGANQVIPIGFYFLEDADIVGYKTTTAGVDSALVLNTNYTLAGAGVEAGGTATMIGGASGEVVTFTRADALTQEIELQYSGDLNPATLERGYDRLCMQVQRVFSIAKRSIRFPLTNAETSELALNSRKGKLLSFDATTGDPTFTDPTELMDSEASVADLLAIKATATATNSTGNTTVTVPAAAPVANAIYTHKTTFSGSAGTRIMILATTNATAGEMVNLVYDLPATASIVIETRNATSGGTLLDTITTDASGDNACVKAFYTGSAWQLLSAQYPSN